MTGWRANTTLLVPDAGFVVTDPIRLALPKGRAGGRAHRHHRRAARRAADHDGGRLLRLRQHFSYWRAVRHDAGRWNRRGHYGHHHPGRTRRPGAVGCASLATASITALPAAAAQTTTDTGDSLLNSGWIERGLQLAGGYGVLSVTRTGDALGSWYLTQNRRFMRLGMLSQLAATVNFGACVFIAGLCVNDVTAGTSSANIIAMMQWLSQDLLAFNPAGLFYATCMPGAVTSTDSFATVANQSVGSSFDTNRKAVNSWLRGGGGLFTGASGRTRTGIIDRAAAVEVANGALGVWGPGMTSDGTHPTQAVHAGALAGLVQTAMGGFSLPS